MQANFPDSIESIPRLGPTDLSSNIFNGAGKAPALKSIDKSVTSWNVNCPVIIPLPPVIGSLIFGALITLLSRIIANKLNN